MSRPPASRFSRPPAAAALIALIGLSAAAPAAAAQERTEPVPAGVVARRDLAYVADWHKRQKLDLYLPENAQGENADGGEPLPVVVWIHGGGWRGGSKTRCPPLEAGFVGRGYAVASVGYRLSGTAPFPAQIEDCRAAIRWLRAHAEEYNLDPARIGVWGASAGGHLVALLGTAGDETAFDVGAHRDRSARVQAVCDYYGPSDFAAFAATPGYEHVAVRPDSPVFQLFDGPASEKSELAERASPVEYVSADDPPFLILHGAEDRVVPLDQSERLHAALRKAGVASTLKKLPDTGHGGGAFNKPEVRKTVAEFFDAQLIAK